MKRQIAQNSIAEGRNQSRLPELTLEWAEKIRGSADFLGLNHYTSRWVELKSEIANEKPSYEKDMKIELTTKPEWIKSNINWHYSVPEGIGGLLRWIKNEYNDPEVIITENGWSDEGQLNDTGRVEYYRSYLEEILTVVLNKECNLKGYAGKIIYDCKSQFNFNLFFFVCLAWSIIDNFEWNLGYTYVDC